MRITLIGTGAGEGYPGFWCDCVYCRQARKLGGKNIRGNTCAMLDEDVLIDMNSHFFEMAVRLGIDPTRIRTLLVTHPHHDHFDPHYLTQRRTPDKGIAEDDKIYSDIISPCFSKLPVLQVYGNSYIEEAIRSYPRGDLLSQCERLHFAFHRIAEGEPMNAENISFVPLRSIHADHRGEAHNYIITREGKTILYASDTGGYEPDMQKVLFRYQYDAVVMEGTFGLGAEYAKHMRLSKNIAFNKELESNGCLKPGAPFCLTHLCPHWTPPHEEYAKMVEAEGMLLGYDGMTIDI